MSLQDAASSAQRDFVEDIINRRNVAITGHDQWYPVAFFVVCRQNLLDKLAIDLREDLVHLG